MNSGGVTKTKLRKERKPEHAHIREVGSILDGT
jgi:hypothetical protein